MWFTTIAFLLLLYCVVNYNFVSLVLTGLVGTLGVGTIVSYMANSGYEKRVNAEFGITTINGVTTTQTSVGNQNTQTIQNNNGGQTI